MQAKAAKIISATTVVKADILVAVIVKENIKQQ